ncbi:MAG: hypothetical protein ACPGFA_01195 [Pikeienuella sp.]
MITPNLINRYFVMSDYGQGDVNFGCDLTDFDGACNELVERQSLGYESTVFRMDSKHGDAPYCADVTEDAIARIKTWLDGRDDSYPEWMDDGASAAEFAACAREDAAHVRSERLGWGEV